MPSPDDQKRLADLIWRSYRMKMALLIGGLACILLISSALRNGRKVVAEINTRSVAARLRWVGDLKAIALQAAPLVSNPSYLDPSEAEIIDEVEFRLYSMFLTAIPLPTIPPQDPKQAAAAERLRGRCNELQRFIEERQNAYNLEFGISNVKSSVFVNALVIIDFWPVILLCTLAAVAAVTMRQHAYEVILSKMIQESQGKEEKAVRSAFTGFLAGELRAVTFGNEQIFVYRRSLILLPEPLITLCLLIALLYLSIGLPATEMRSLFRLNSTLFGYHTALIVFGGLLIFVLAATKSYYDSIIREATGATVLSWLGFQIGSGTRMIESRLSTKSMYTVAVFVLCAIAITSLFLPWLGNWRLSGFELFLPQKPIVPNSPIAFYKIEPTLIREMRVELAIALTFIVVMLFGRLVHRRHLESAILRLSYYYSFIVFALMVNIVVYLMLLGYNAQRTIIEAMLNMIFPSDSIAALTAPRGLPLVIQYPMYGFFLFAFSLAGLCVLAMLHRGQRDPLEDANGA